MPASRGSTPSTGSPVASSAETTSAACRALPALFRITPLIRTLGSKVCSPCTMAAAVRETWLMSRTRITGASTSVARWAVEAKPSPPIWPSNRPITPSRTAMSAGLGVLAPCEQQRRHLVRPAQVRVEVAPGPPGGQRVVARVDVVRADLEPGHLQALAAQGPHQPGGDVVLP